MSGSNLRLAFVLEAIDKATSTITKVNARIDKLTEPARKVRAAFGDMLRESRLDRVAAAASNVGDRLGAVRDRVMGIGASLTMLAGMAGGALWGFKRVADEVDRLADQAAVLSMTTQQLQRMGYAAQLNGSSTEEMGDALRFLSRNLVEARNGSKELVQWFARIGVSERELAKISVTDAFHRMADTFERVGDEGQNGAKKVAAMQALLGRSGSQLKQVLDQGSAGLKKFYDEADRLGVTLSAKTLRSMGEFNDGWDRMRLVVFGATSTALSAAAPVLLQLIDRLTEWTARNRDLIATRFAEWVERVVDGLPGFVDGVERLAGGLVEMFRGADKVAQAIGGWPNLFAVLAGLMGVQMVASVGALALEIGALNIAIGTNPFGALLLAVAALIAVLPVLVMHWDKVLEKMRALHEFRTSGNWLWGGGGLANMPTVPTEQERRQAGSVGAGRGLLNPAAGLAGGRTEVGGTLRIEIAPDGRPRVSNVSKAPYSPMELDVSYAGGVLAMPN